MAQTRFNRHVINLVSSIEIPLPAAHEEGEDGDSLAA
jgi:hypothetical protein